MQHSPSPQGKAHLADLAELRHEPDCPCKHEIISLIVRAALNMASLDCAMGLRAGARPAFGSRRPACSGQMLMSRRLSVTVTAASSQSGGFGADILKLAKKIQGSLPIIGLVSRLATPEGGFDELAYPEYCRSVFEKAPRSMSIAMQELESAHGKLAASRWVLLMLWMSNTGAGLVPGKDVLAAARRLRVTQDIEVEIDRFEGARLVTRKKYEMVAPPPSKPEERAAVAADGLCTLSLGLKDGQAPSSDDSKRLIEILVGGVDGLSREAAEAVMAGRGHRAVAYS